MVGGLPWNHYFMQSDKVRDTCIEGLLMKMGDRNFAEPQLQRCVNKKALFMTNCQETTGYFLDLMDEKTVKVDGYYKLLLPLEDEDI